MACSKGADIFDIRKAAEAVSRFLSLQTSFLPLFFLFPQKGPPLLSAAGVSWFR